MLTTMNVAMARQTASDSVNFQMARMQRTVQATSETVMTMNDIIRTTVGSITPFKVFGVLSVTSIFSVSIEKHYNKFKTAQSETIEITTQRIRPCIIGRGPTAFNVARERLAPIRKSVNVIPAFARATSESNKLGGTIAGE